MTGKLFWHHFNVKILGLHHLLSKIRGSKTEFIRQCVWLVILELKFSNTFSNEKMTYIEIIDLDEYSKLSIHDFFIWIHLELQKLVWRSHFKKIQTWLGQIESNATLNDLGWKFFEYKGVRTHQDQYSLYRSSYITILIKQQYITQAQQCSSWGMSLGYGRFRFHGVSSAFSKTLGSLFTINGTIRSSFS